MSGIVKTIIIGASITIGVLFLTLFGLYKIMDTKDTNTNDTNTKTYNEYNTNTSRSSTNENEDKIEDNIESNKDNEDVEENNNIQNTTNDTITIYMFKGNGCPHCEDATEYFLSIKDELKNIEIVSYEVWYNSNNRDLMQSVADELNIEVSGIPFFVIGNYAITGFDTGDKLIDKAQELLEDKNYKDVVKEVLEEIKIDVESEKITS